jgi:RimJ/RimL family protein N-acetyltransferase
MACVMSDVTDFPKLQTRRLVLVSPLTHGFDIESAYLENGRHAFIDATPDDDALWWSMAMVIGHWRLRGFGHFAVMERHTGAHVGLVGPWFPKGWPEPELAWHLMTGFEGQGYATEAAECVLRWLFNDLKWQNVISLVSDDNASSVALARRLGATPEGEFSHRLGGTYRIWRHDRAAYIAETSDTQEGRRA